LALNSNMKKLSIVFTLFFALVSFANAQHKAQKSQKLKNNNKTNHKTDTLAYTLEILNQESKGCNDNCSFVQISYPLFKNRPKLNKIMVNETLNYLGNDYVDYYKLNNIDTAFKHLADDYLQGTEPDIINGDSTEVDSAELSQNITYLDIIARPYNEDSHVIVIEFDEDMSGGAHPNSEYTYINWDKKTDRLIKLEDIIRDWDKFAVIAEKIFWKDAKSNGNSAEGYNFPDGKFELNGNFQIMPEGIVFYYNAYEIAPYAYGPTRLLIPYTKIKSLLLPHTVIAQYIK